MDDERKEAAHMIPTALELTKGKRSICQSREIGDTTNTLPEVKETCSPKMLLSY